MKKLFRIILIAMITTLTTISCTEEQVTPTENDGGTSSGSNGNGSGGQGGNP